MKKLFTMCALALAAMLTAQAVNIEGGTKLYLNTGGVWGSGGDRFAIYFSDGTGDAWADMTATATAGLFETTVPEGSWSLLIYCRLNGAVTGTSWDNVWNQTEDLTYDGTNNLYTITGWGSGFGAKCTGEWSFHNAAAPVVSLTVPAFVFLGEANITLEVASENVTDPVYTYYVKTPDAADFTAMEGTTYKPTVAGEHTFRVTVAESTSSDNVLAEVEKTVAVRELPEPITIKVKVPAEWGPTISLWCWDEYDAGHWLYTTVDGEWYIATLERLYPASFIVVNGTGWSATGDNSQQTVDVANITASGCYEVGAVSTDEANQGKREVTTIDCGDEPGSGTGMAAIESSVQAWANGQDIQAVFDGVQRVQVYTVSGQLLHEIQAEGTFSYPATRGLYLLRIGGDTYKVAVK